MDRSETERVFPAGNFDGKKNGETDNERKTYRDAAGLGEME